MQGGERPQWGSCLAALLLSLLLAAPCQAEPGSIQTASARLVFSGGYVGAETLEQLQTALDSTTHQAIVEQLRGDLDYVVANKKQIVGTLGTVFNRILTERGFSATEISIDPAPHTVVTVRLQLDSEAIREVRVRFFMLGNSPLVEALTQPDTSAIATALHATVAGTPVSDTLWLHRMLREGVEEQLRMRPAYGEFVHEVFVEPGETTRVVVALTPNPGAVLITRQAMRTYSVTLLNAQLEPVRERGGYYLAGLLGAPRSFVSAKSGLLSSELLSLLLNDCALLADCPDAEIELQIENCDILVDFGLESRRSLLQASFRLDLRPKQGGTDEIFGRLRLRGGMVPQPGWAVYGGADYYAGEGQIHTFVGAGRLLGARGMIGAGYDFASESLRFEGQHDLAPEAYISADYYSNRDYDHLSEVALHWRLQHAYELQLATSFDGGVFAAVAARF